LLAEAEEVAEVVEQVAIDVLFLEKLLGQIVLLNQP